MTTYFKIQSALSTQLLTTVGLPGLAQDNVPYKPVLGQPYVRDTFMPVEPAFGSLGITGYDQLRGLYQIDVLYPENQGSDVAWQMCDSIIASFPRGLQLATDDVPNLEISHTWTQTPRSIQAYYWIPVMVRWNVYGG